MRLTLIALLLAGVAGCGSEPADELGRSVEDPKLEEKVAQPQSEDEAAPDGDPQSQFEMGKKYAAGEGVLQDDTEAVKWYRKAAEQGHARAQNNLGWMYENGLGVPQDDTEAVKWYRKAAEQGVAAAQHSLGLVYVFRDDGVPEDDTEAVKWYRKAAEQGYAEAQLSLGGAYFDGIGVPQDYLEAYAWYSLAATNGDEVAKEGLPLVKAELTPDQLIAAQKRATELFEQINANKAK